MYIIVEELLLSIFIVGVLPLLLNLFAFKGGNN